MSKINVTLDVSKISKDKIVSRTFKNRDGEEVTVKEYKVELIELKAPKFVKEGEGWKMIKTHFVVEAQTKEERANKVDQNFIGDGFVFEEKSSPTNEFQQLRDNHNSQFKKEDEPNVDDIPF